MADRDGLRFAPEPASDQARRLRDLVRAPEILVVPGVWDALTARLVARAGFGAAFLSGYAVSAARLGLPDAGLISYREMLDAGREACAAAPIPLIGDADTGFGSAVNVHRTVAGFHAAGFACVMIEDQVFPKRCGYAKGLEVAPRAEALTRLRAALDARDAIRARGGELLVIGRTDSRAAAGLEEALWRAEAFADLGADVVYFEAPADRAEMELLNRRIGHRVPTMLAQLEKEDRPLLAPAEARDAGYAVLLQGVTLLNAHVRAMRDALALLAGGTLVGPDRLVPFAELYETVGFEAYYALESRYGPGAG